MPAAAAADGTTIAYDVLGAGPDVVLVHGITECRRTWDPVAERLATSRRVIALDLRGHGASALASSYDLGSMAADVGAVAAAAGATSPLLVGHSLGGAVVSAAAAAGIGRAVVNVDQPLALGAFQAVLREIEPALRGDAATCEAAVTAVLESMTGQLTGDEQGRVAALRRPIQDVVLGVWDLVLTAPLAELETTVDALAGAISVPYLAVHGIDPGPDYAAWLTARIPTATVEVWPDHGHYPHLVDPDRFVARVLSFDEA